MAAVFSSAREPKLKALFISGSLAFRYKERPCRSGTPAMPLPRPRFHLPRLRALPVLGAAACAAVLWGAIALQAPSAQSDESDHELARQALQQGKVLPLRTVLDQVEREYKGQVIKVEFEHDDGRFIYELRVLQADGRVLKVKINAVNGKVLSVRQKGRD